MKKILISFSALFALLMPVLFAQDIAYPYDDPDGNPITSTFDNGDISELLSDNVRQEDGILTKILGYFGFDLANEYAGPAKALIYVKTIINLLLGLTSFIALIIIIYSFYLMFFADDSKGMDTVKKNMKGVVIALLILGCSWVIVSFIFNFYQQQMLGVA